MKSHDRTKAVPTGNSPIKTRSPPAGKVSSSGLCHWEEQVQTQPHPTGKTRAKAQAFSIERIFCLLLFCCGWFVSLFCTRPALAEKLQAKSRTPPPPKSLVKTQAKTRSHPSGDGQVEGQVGGIDGAEKKGEGAIQRDLSDVAGGQDSAVQQGGAHEEATTLVHIELKGTQ